ncbi:putative malate dehydrogenase 1B [Varanus komodoensis]|nr:putative malate dehydrogenase 1B [Varanus komodoensis]
MSVHDFTEYWSKLSLRQHCLPACQQKLNVCTPLAKMMMQYYNITSDMMTEEMFLIAKENLQTHIEIDREEKELKSLINPLHIWINRASAHICYHLIPLLTNGQIFGMGTEVSLHLLDRRSSKDELEGIVMETQDLASPTLRSVSFHTELDEVFLDADVIILLDDILQETIPTIEECIRQVTDQCEIYGPLIKKNAKSDVKIIVIGKTFVNLKALMLMRHAPSVNRRNIVTLAMLLESEAKAMLARKLQMHPAGKQQMKNMEPVILFLPKEAECHQQCDTGILDMSCRALV